ncbi:MAG: hypothetical protein IPK17_16815 [Chloroflexi bacterium]|uniref:ArnT family glycosyltransferase n=1 Tax=Candidatus Flexifilum breve TaxID=3140694 RepID=UPI003135C1B9|nr:hypothetical protein [Chloroflexota bacterium]
MNRQLYLILITAALLFGAALRATGIDQMSGMVHYDEAYYALDALSLIDQPRFTPFFPDNFGRESLWMYWEVPALAVFGADAFSLRVTAFFTSLLTLSAVGLLARVLFSRRVAVWTVAALGALFWHVLFSHLAFRALLYPTIGALAFAGLWLAWHTNRLRHWLLTGAAFGALSYTYFAARGWIALALGLLLIGVLVDRRRWRGSAVTMLVAAALSLPLVVYLLTTPAASQRLDQVAISDLNALISNLGVWLNVWVGHGADDPMYNLSGRPLLDVPLAIIGVVGLVVLFVSLLALRVGLTPQPPLQAERGRKSAHFKPPRPWERGFRGEAVFFILALAAVSVAPAVLTTEPLKWLRAIGLIVPLALVLGVGLDALQQLVVRLGQRTRHASSLHRPQSSVLSPVFWAGLIPAGLILWAGLNSARDFQAWVTSDDLYMPMEQHLYAGIDEIAANTPSEAPVYFAPFTADHPVLRFREWRLGDRPVAAFKSVDCLPLTTLGGTYFALDAYEGDLAAQLAQWREVVSVTEEASEAPQYTLVMTAPETVPFAAQATFGERIAARLASFIPSVVRVGGTISLDVALRRVGPVDEAYTLFLHTYPFYETRLITQADRPICPSYPPPLWRDDETLILHYDLPVPAQPGEYRIALGVYNSATGERLSFGSIEDAAIVGTIRVEG